MPCAGAFPTGGLVYALYLGERVFLPLDAISIMNHDQVSGLDGSCFLRVDIQWVVLALVLSLIVTLPARSPTQTPRDCFEGTLHCGLSIGCSKKSKEDLTFSAGSSSEETSQEIGML